MSVKAILLALCAVVAAACPIRPAVAAEPIRFGAVLSVSGPASFLGEPEKNTIQMEVEKLNAAGGVLGRPIEVVILDDETDVNKAVLAVDRLIKKEQVAAILGPTTSGNTLAVMGKAAAAKVPLISCSAAEKITKPVNPSIFKVAPSDRLAVARILSHAKKQGYRKLAILTVSDGFGQAGREVLKELIPAQGFELTADEVFGPKDTDMTAQLTNIQGTAPDAVICWGTNPGPAVVAKNRVQLGMKTPLYMSHGVASKKFIELAGDAAEGLLLPAGKITVAEKLPDADPEKAQLVAYAKAYEERFKAPVSTFGGHGYDSLHLAAKAVADAGSDKPQAIRDALEKTKAFPGIGGIFTFTPEDHAGLGQDAFIMLGIEKGDWVIVGD
ncbi:Extracellular ligand-binding receptor [Solidesulfovibrio carbinoliphilus subsp. oakridgensis]|uniref:Extracellular ligand-binding receptor n=1 Tax=Solidesulfovibrio carbinoliphilus subsp. oakridgensis TaxID=694327 RepID=G7Q5C8_9BACT|nr:ABC transporter substrate-binding protein [Solidesulfovibrio carbinoliphilus]EHJ48929.1 Extracellular ligand-binding receptor [Solidesulfovibrio carbinoliphilus subsp. oakridgensis]